MNYYDPCGPKNHGIPNAIPLSGDMYHPSMENNLRKEVRTMSERRAPNVGDLCVYHDPKGKPSNALITAVWGPYMINIVFVSNDGTQRDDYGRQIKRETSIPMIGYPFGQPNAEGSLVHGNYCRWPEEEPVPYREPQQV